MIVSAFADASFDHRTKAAGFAIWIKSGATTLRYAGPFKAEVFSSQEAETLALANAIVVAIKRLNMQRGDKLVAASDCKEAIAALYGKRTGCRHISDAIAATRVLVSERGVIMTIRHVKAHLDNSVGPRHAVNNWCDENAKSVMRKRRAELRAA